MKTVTTIKEGKKVAVFGLENTINRRGYRSILSTNNKNVNVLIDLAAQTINITTLQTTGAGWIPTDITFKAGDVAIYGSFNFDYMAKITKITDKVITLEDNGEVYRVKLEKFVWRNYKFNLEKSLERRLNWYD